MKKLMHAVLFCLLPVMILLAAGCSTWKTGTSKPKKAKKKNSGGQGTDFSWIRGPERAKDQDINRRIIQDFEVFPGRKGYRSESLHTRDPISF